MTPSRPTFRPRARSADPAEELRREEADLARAAAAGDLAAFGTLYDRYERRIYNFCYRLTSSTDDGADATQEAFLKVLERLPKLGDRELDFGAYLFTVARHASYRVTDRRRRTETTDAPPEPGSGGGPEPEPVAPEDDPERATLLESQQEEIRAANARLPERQREALALRELEGLSYDEIADLMGMNRNSVAQLISRARIRLRAELRGEALGSVASATGDCKRALPLIAERDDGQLRDAAQRDWLAEHIEACDSCRVGEVAMQEAGASYRGWLPLVPAAVLRDETMAHAAELLGVEPGGADASGDAGGDGADAEHGGAEAGGDTADAGADGDGEPGDATGADAEHGRWSRDTTAAMGDRRRAHRRRRLAAACAAGAIVVLGFATLTASGALSGTEAEQAANTVPAAAPGADPAVPTAASVKSFDGATAADRETPGEQSPADEDGDSSQPQDDGDEPKGADDDDNRTATTRRRIGPATRAMIVTTTRRTDPTVTTRRSIGPTATIPPATTRARRRHRLRTVRARRSRARHRRLPHRRRRARRSGRGRRTAPARVRADRLARRAAWSGSARADGRRAPELTRAGRRPARGQLTWWSGPPGCRSGPD